jgi:nucleotide-binding universal stress UspA family protein
MTRLLDRLPHELSLEATRAILPPARTVLVATDGTPSSRAALQKGLSMAQELGARVTFVSAYLPPGQLLESRTTSVRLAIGSPWLARLSTKRRPSPRRSAPMPITRSWRESQRARLLAWRRPEMPISSSSARVTSPLQSRRSAAVSRAASSPSPTEPCL